MLKKLKFAIIFEPVKRFLSFLFVLLLSAQCIFKLSIITYFEANRDYIAEVLCINKEQKITTCYGQCFLDRNLALIDTGTDEQESTNHKTQVEPSIFVITTTHFTLGRNFSLQGRPEAPQPLYAYDLTHTLFHPPC